MADFKLTKTRITEGVWEGTLTLFKEFDSPPRIRAMHHNTEVDGLEMTADLVPGSFTLRLPLSNSLISDTFQTILLVDADTDDVLNSIQILAGDALAEDLRAEVDLLRQELDMLKRAFRRHCVETA